MLSEMNVIGTAGHVDHGKSTLVERLTGIDPDRFAEEKRRGLTIDLGFAWLSLPSGREVGLIDVPGHERFIKNMLAGAGGISVALFVVAANEGWKPQSAEHLSIIDLLGISSGVIALTKSDTVDPGPLADVTEEVRERISHSSLRDAPIVPCSAITGDGISDLIAAVDEALASAAPASDRGRPRLWVDRVFTIAGAGTVVTGTLEGGRLSTGTEVEISPEGRRARVRGIQSHKKKVDEIGPGNRVALNLVGLDRDGAERGDAIVAVKQWRSTRRVDALVRVLPTAISGHEHELTEKGAHLLYMGSAETPVRIRILGRDRLRSGETGFVQLALRDPLPIARGDRFVLRDAGRVVTFGGGEVLDPLSSPLKRAEETERVDLLEQLRDTDPLRAALALVDSEGSLKREDIDLRIGADVPGLEEATWLGDLLPSRSFYESWIERLHATLAEHHRARPLERGLPRETLRARLDLDPSAFDALVASDGEVVGEGALLRLRTHEVALDPEQQRSRDELVARIEGGGFAPPLEKELDADPALLRSLVEAGELIRIDGFFLTPALASEARTRVRAAIETDGPRTVAEIRDLLGTSRKYAVPLCEWLDRTGATRRRGDVRELGPSA